MNNELGKLVRRFNAEVTSGDMKGTLSLKSPSWVAGLHLNIN